MMSDIAAEIQMRVPQALKQMASVELEAAARTHKLAKRLKLLGVRCDVSGISIELTQLASSDWGRKFATFVGGTSDPLDQYVWALPKQE